MLSFLSCEKDKDMMLSTLTITNEELVPSYTSVSVSCQIKSESTVRNVYLQYAASEDFVEYAEIQMQEDKNGYSVQVNGLEDNTTYFIRYAASNRYSSIIGTDISQFTTLAASLPSVKLDSIFGVLDTCAKAHVTLETDGNAPILEMGVCWNIEEPTCEHSRNTTNDSVATISIVSLKPNTKYYVRAYAKNKVGIAYSESVAFLTLDVPKVQTKDITNIQITSVLLNGVLIFNGNDTTIVKGFCWSENPQPTINNNYSQVTTDGNEFSYQLSNLKDETKYYIRAYAKNKVGISYGEEKSFMTQSAVIPTITTSSATNISYTSATVGGNVTSDGGTTVTERGIVYSTTQNPTTSSSTKVTSGTGTGSFACNMSNLQDGTTYYVRAYAINKKGTSYGEQKSFTTKAYGLPIVTTSSATNISYTSATVGGNVTSDGGTAVTERGIVYSTTQNPTTSSSTKVTSGTGTGSFTCSLENLQEGTTYYVRAYAINKKGTSYGENVVFNTLYHPYFSVDSTKTIVFAPGNLQYNRKTKKWSFASEQYEMIGYGNFIGYELLADVIDVFSWSCSSTDFGVSINGNTSEYTDRFRDWGGNAIGDSPAYTWRTLSVTEWSYLIKRKNNNSEPLYGIAEVNGVAGVVLLPDNWVSPINVTFKTGVHTEDGMDFYGDYQEINLVEWKLLESLGAVFLPATGQNFYASIIRLDCGRYWSSTCGYKYSNNSYDKILCSYEFSFTSNHVGCAWGGAIFNRRAVRLVKDL